MISLNRVLGYLSFGFLCGTAVAAYLYFSWMLVLVTACSGFLFLTAFARSANKPVVLWGGILLLGLALGLARLGWEDAQHAQGSAVSQLNGQAVEIEGEVAQDPTTSQGGAFVVVNVSRAAKESNNLSAFQGKVRVSTDRFTSLEVGDTVSVSGKLQTPPRFSDFDYAGYLAKDGILSIMTSASIKKTGENYWAWFYRMLFSAKRSLVQSINKFLPQPQAAFVNGVLVGERQDIPEEIQKAFNDTSTTHLVALSGFNITIIAQFIQRLAQGLALSSGAAFWMAVAGVGIFTVGTGASASVVRAAIMGILGLVALRSGRKYSGRFALLFAGTVMVGLQPNLLRFDVGFQLSFLATLGLIYFSDFFKEKLHKIPEIFYARSNLATTFAAQVFVLPLLIIYFHKISFISPLVNVLVLPLIPWMMAVGFVGGVVGVVVPILAPLAHIPTWAISSLALKIITTSASFPGAAWNLTERGAEVSGAIMLLAVAIIFIWKFWRDRRIAPNTMKDE